MLAKTVRSKNNSPWIKELRHDREVKKLEDDEYGDVVIIGGGIAGMVTAFFTLRFTDKNVILVEAEKIAHGATGHNAGQVVDYFEKYFSEIVEEYGLEMASKGQNAITSAWDLLDFIFIETGIDINFPKFIGYAGCNNLSQLLNHFENKLLKIEGGVSFYKSKVAREFLKNYRIPRRYSELYEIVPQKEILELLETDNEKYIALLQSRKGCLNSALFVEKLEKYLSEHYKERFKLFENTKVDKIFLSKSKAVVETNDKLIECKNVVLCTNAFENIEIISNKLGDKIDKDYHNMVYGIVGYMVGFVETHKNNPIAISYFQNKREPSDQDPYFYLTRRNYKYNGRVKSLVCIGGPEQVHDEDQYLYYNSHVYPKSALEKIQSFVEKNFRGKYRRNKKFDFKWHGLMGYTPSGIRIVGPEPSNPVLLYNLGCNGIGILPSIYGGKKIADHLDGKLLPKTIFDPEVQREVSKKNKFA